jgi:hypothetical protein
VDCREFDGQVVRLEGIKEIADAFVRVRLERLADSDLSVFEFDYDLTMMIFFINSDEQILGRYGGRDANGPDSRHSLAGLKYTMQQCFDAFSRGLELPARPGKSTKVRQFMDSNGGGRRGCIHCHHVKETLNERRAKQGAANHELAWRFPLPENLGISLEVDRGNVVKKVAAGSAAAVIGLRAGDTVKSLGDIGVRSFADAQYALDKAPAKGVLRIVWQRRDALFDEQLRLDDGWRRSDILWRPSMYKMIASPRVFGDDLDKKEKAMIGLTEKQLAFRQRDSVSTQARQAGIRAGDIILGFAGKQLEMDAYEFQSYVRREYLSGDLVKVMIIRDGQRITLPMTLH